jgi:ERCC4-type nuclease
MLRGSDEPEAESAVTLVAPTEPPPIKALGFVSLTTEMYGVDVLFPAYSGLAGVQRKELSDFYASMRDGRLAKEVSQMQSLATRALIIEGSPRFTRDGDLMHSYIRWDRSSYERLIFSLLSRGIWVLYTRDVLDTARLITELRTWCNKTEHLALDRHPMPKSHWLDNGRVWASRVLQSVDGIGPKHADEIVKAFDGLPVRLTCTEEELLAIKGIGKEKVRRLMKAFGGSNNGTAS